MSGTQKAMPRNYVLVTAAKDEEACIEKTILSVVAQTVRPLRWVIVNDGSTDGTQALIEEYSKAHPFIHVVLSFGAKNRDYSSKVRAITEGLETISGIEYGFIGNLDADIVV